MPNYSLNNTVPEPDRSMENLGFDTMDPHPGAAFPKGTSTNETMAFDDQIVDSANTTKQPWPTPVGGNYGLRRG